MKSICSKCISETNHKVLEECTQNLSEEETGWWKDHSYQIIQCLGCDSISFRKLYNDAAQQQEFGFSGKWNWSQEVYPKRTLYSLSIANLTLAPNIIRIIYGETIEAYHNNQFILCAAGLRALVEGICNDKEIKGSDVLNKKKETIFSTNLNGKIEGLAVKGVLTRKNAKILHQLRFLGNGALHELSEPSEVDLKSAINIIEHIIKEVYLIEHEGEKLKKRNNK